MSNKIFGTRTTALEVIEGHNLSGYEIIVTDGTSDLGAEIVKVLSKAGARVVIASHDLNKANQVANEIKKTIENNKIEVEKLELDNLKSVNEFCKRYLAKKRHLNILINNASIMACPLIFTVDGFESQLGTNFIGHFALTTALIPALRDGFKKSGKVSRVISVTSIAHGLSDFHYDDPNFIIHLYDKWQSYGQSKTANVLFSTALTKYYSDKGIVSNAVMPGIMTNLEKNLTDEEKSMFGIIDDSDNYNSFLKNVEQGAATCVWAAVATELEGRGGLYLEDCNISVLRSSYKEILEHNNGYLEYAVNQEKAIKLWKLTENMIKESSKKKFTIFNF